MQNIFRPDVFSRTEPEFEPVTTTALDQITDVISVNYSHFDGLPLSGSKLAGLEINSQNYKVKIGGKSYALKRLGEQVNGTVYKAQLSVSQNLLQNGIYFPQIVQNNNGNYCSLDADGQIWILAEFVEGEYYSGSRSQFFLLADKIGLMQHYLESVSSLSLPRSVAAESWSQTSKSLSDLFERKDDWSSLFPLAECNALLMNCEILNETFQMVDNKIDNFSDRLVPTHIDLHPHNILINPAGQPVFVDVDSLQVSGKIQSIAFATYKLARQYVVCEQLEDSPRIISRSTRKFVECINDVSNLGYDDYEQVKLAAMTEVLRRIAIISDLNINYKQEEWNAVLHMHFDALREIPILFD